MECGVAGEHSGSPYLGTQSPVMTLSGSAWVPLNRLRSGVRRFLSCLHKWGIALYGPSAAY